MIATARWYVLAAEYTFQSEYTNMFGYGLLYPIWDKDKHPAANAAAWVMKAVAKSESVW